MVTSPGGCRQTLIRHRAGSSIGKLSSSATRSSSAALLKTSARRLPTGLLFLSLAQVSIVRAFRLCHGWKELGYARLSDHAREGFTAPHAGWVTSNRGVPRLFQTFSRLQSLSEVMLWVGCRGIRIRMCSGVQTFVPNVHPRRTGSVMVGGPGCPHAGVHREGGCQCELAADRMLSSFLMAMPGALWQRAHLRKPTDPDRL